jgi:hypothetical protein
MARQAYHQMFQFLRQVLKGEIPEQMGRRNKVQSNLQLLR